MPARALAPPRMACGVLGHQIATARATRPRSRPQIVKEAAIRELPAVTPLNTRSPIRGKVRGAPPKTGRVKPLGPTLSGTSAAVLDPATAVPSDAATVSGGPELAMRKGEATERVR